MSSVCPTEKGDASRPSEIVSPAGHVGTAVSKVGGSANVRLRARACRCLRFSFVVDWDRTAGRDTVTGRAPNAVELHPVSWAGMAILACPSVRECPLSGAGGRSGGRVVLVSPRRLEGLRLPAAGRCHGVQVPESFDPL
jgi:hypothetical protein